MKSVLPYNNCEMQKIAKSALIITYYKNILVMKKRKQKIIHMYVLYVHKNLVYVYQKVNRFANDYSLS